MSSTPNELDCFDQADDMRPRLGMTYKVLVVSYYSHSGRTERHVYPANSLAEAKLIEAATDPDESRDRTVFIIPDVMEYLRCHYPEALHRHNQRG